MGGTASGTWEKIIELADFFKSVSIPLAAVLIVVYLVLIGVSIVMGHDKENLKAVNNWKKAIITTVVILVIMFLVPTIFDAIVSIMKGDSGYDYATNGLFNGADTSLTIGGA